MGPRVLSQVIFSIKPFSALGTNMSLLPRMDHKVQRELFLALKSLQAHRAHVGPFRIVRLFVTREVVLSLQPRTADITNEPSFQCVAY